MKVAFSWDDGAPEDKKLFELHEKYEIPGMFFVPTRNREGRKVLTPEEIRSCESQYISFGGHTHNHTYLTSIPIDQVEDEILQNKNYLGDILGHEIEDFCFPGGQYNQSILDIVNKHFKTSRTADTMSFKYQGGPLKPTFHFYPRGYKSLVGNALRNGSYGNLIFLLTHPQRDYFELMRGIIRSEADRDSVVMIWGHSWEIEELGLWDELEKIMKVYKQFSVCAYSELFTQESVIL